MGLMLCPGDGDTSSPDAEWSYTGFAAFRHQLALAEGFTLSEMDGFGGELPWSDISTPLEPLLNRADDGGGKLSPAQCAVMLPRLEAIVDQWQGEAGTSLTRTRIHDARRLLVVLQICVTKEVELLVL